MSKFNILYQMADDIFDTDMIYWWEEQGFIIWRCYPTGFGPKLSQ